MTFLARMVAEGWWDRSRRPNSPISAESFTEENIKQLLTIGQAEVFDPNGVFLVTLRPGTDLEKITGESFEVLRVKRTDYDKVRGQAKGEQGGEHE